MHRLVLCRIVFVQIDFQRSVPNLVRSVEGVEPSRRTRCGGVAGFTLATSQQPELAHLKIVCRIETCLSTLGVVGRRWGETEETVVQGLGPGRR